MLRSQPSLSFFLEGFLVQNKRVLTLSGTAVASIGVLLAATPTVAASAAVPAPGVLPMSPAVALISHDDDYGYGYGYDDDDDDYYYGSGYYDDDRYDDDDDDDDDDRRGGGIGNFIANFLANNQDQVLAVTAMIPTFYLGPVAVGNSLLANAYYNGYEGSAAGGEGVLAYVVSQIGVPPTDIVQSLVLGATSLVPQFNIGPVAVGNSLLANAWFSGYDGSATGLPGVISYVTSQLGLQAAPAAAVAARVNAPAAGESDPATASVSRSAAAAQDAQKTVAGDGPAAVDSTDADPSDAVAVSVRADVAPSAAGNSARAGEAGKAGDTEDSARSAGRGGVAAKAAGGARSGKARQGRSAAARSGGGDS